MQLVHLSTLRYIAMHCNQSKTLLWETLSCYTFQLHATLQWSKNTRCIPRCCTRLLCQALIKKGRQPAASARVPSIYFHYILLSLDICVPIIYFHYILQVNNETGEWRLVFPSEMQCSQVRYNNAITFLPLNKAAWGAETDSHISSVAVFLLHIVKAAVDTPPPRFSQSPPLIKAAWGAE